MPVFERAGVKIGMMDAKKVQNRISDQLSTIRFNLIALQTAA